MAVSYINKIGGTKSSRLNTLGIEIALWCEDRQLSISPCHLPGTLNVIADAQSRRDKMSHDWKINHLVFNRIFKLWEVDVDLFAAERNVQLPKFVSWGPQPLLSHMTHSF